MDLLGYIATGLGGYLLGSIPFGYLVARGQGIDIRRVGSGNIGATNVLRTLGKPAGIMVLLLDAFKGYAAVAWLAALVPGTLGLASVNAEWMRLVAAVAAVLGHNYTCWLRFRGGKGIATSAGVLAALVPWSLLIIAVVWFITTLATGYVSLGSIAASLALPLACWLTGESTTMILVTSVMSALAVGKHRTNIQRLLQGTESRFTLRKKEATP